MIEKPSFTKRLLHSTLALDFKNQRIDVEAVPLTCPVLPRAFHLARVAVVADVHLPDQVVDIPRLLRLIPLQKPDAILIPGDLTNSYTDFDAKGLYVLARELTKIAPCFAVPGNHEQRLNREPQYRRILEQCGVHYLCDSYADWHKDGETLRLYGDLINAGMHLITPGASSAELINYYDENCATITVPLDPALSAAANAQKYYKDYAKAKNAEKILSEQMARAEVEAEYLGAVLEELSRAESEADLAEIREELELEGKKIYAYMPTWRGSVGNIDQKANTYFKYYLYELDKLLDDDEIICPSCGNKTKKGKFCKKIQ